MSDAVRDDRAVPPARSAPSREEVIAAVEQAGSSLESFFGYPERKDGLYLQQDPEEFGSFVHYMATKAPPAALSLDIGIASGGATKFLRDYYPVAKTIVVDMGVHPSFVHWAQIKPRVNSEIIEEIISDSHDPKVRERLLPYAGQVDFAFIDGDHSYFGLRKDIFLAKELLRPGAILALHDTAAVPDCRRVFDDLMSSKSFAILRNFPIRFGISVWRMLDQRRAPTRYNRWSGRGKL